MAFAEGSVKATIESVRCHVNAVYATQFSFGDPEFDVKVIEQDGKVIATVTYGDRGVQEVNGLLGSSELNGFESYTVGPFAFCLQIDTNASISPYGYYITDLFIRTGGNLTTSLGDTFKTPEGDIKFSSKRFSTVNHEIWVSRKEFIESLAAI
jgi:hypothetical protein